MPKYIFKRAVVDVIHGSFSDGDEVELSAAQAKALAPFIEPVGRGPAPKFIETAEAQIEAETAVVKPVRRKRKTKG